MTANGSLNEIIRFLKDVIMASANEAFYLSNTHSYGFFFMSYYISKIYQYILNNNGDRELIYFAPFSNRKISNVFLV